MREKNIFIFIKNALSKQLLASAPKENYSEFHESLFTHNLQRILIQSIIVVIVNIGLIITHLLTLSVNHLRHYYLAALLVQCVLMLVAIFVCNRIDFNTISKKSTSTSKTSPHYFTVIYVVVYLLSELAIFLASLQGVGSLLRIVAITFIACSIPVISQKISVPILAVFYLILFIFIPRLDYSTFFYPYISTYNFWLACACSIITSCSVYSWFVNNVAANMEINKKNAELEVEVNERTKLLDAVNEITEELLEADNDNYETVLFDCIKKIGEVVDVDCINIWKNNENQGDIFTSRIYEWQKEENSFFDNSEHQNISMQDDLIEIFLNKKCINSTMDGLADNMKGGFFSEPDWKDVESVLITPISLSEEFWGIVSFADCKKARKFSEMEEEILGTISLLFAESIVHHQMTMQLLEAAEKALESSKAKSSFLANMSHEIRTPINAITGMLTIAKTAGSKEENLRCLSRIEAASKQLLSVINDILDMSKIEAGKIELLNEPFEMLSALQNVESIMTVPASQKDISLIVDFDDSLPQVVIADDVRISQVLINLLSNAIKFTSQNGEIRFSARKISSNDEGFSEIEFAVQDNGIGIAEENQAHLFDAFEQAHKGVSKKFGGTGLGLAISKRISEMMNGSIMLESTLGVGTTFTVHVFVEEGTVDMLSSNEEESTYGTDFTGYKALLVDDIEINREITITMLEETHLEIDTAEDGKIALDAITNDPSKYDIILMDIQMPVMDGYTATEKIRGLDSDDAKNIPIIAMTANVFSEDIAKCREVGMNDHVAKPIEYGELIKKIAFYLFGTDEKVN